MSSMDAEDQLRGVLGGHVASAERKWAESEQSELVDGLLQFSSRRKISRA
jgi:hypothetical protein